MWMNTTSYRLIYFLRLVGSAFQSLNEHYVAFERVLRCLNEFRDLCSDLVWMFYSSVLEGPHTTMVKRLS